MAKAKTSPRSQAPLVPRPPPAQGIAAPESPNANDSLSAAVAAAKKKKKKGKGKKADDELGNGIVTSQQISNTPFSATAQAQADLLATASDLYRRIEADPQGIPDDDAYWTSLPSHLRTFIRNALPIGQLPASARNDVDDPNNKQASTQAMIAVAQQLAQAAHASQLHLKQHPPSNNANYQPGNNLPYPPFPFDPSVFADLALQAEQALPLHSHPNSTPDGTAFHYSHGNPPPSLPPGEPLPAPVVMVNEFDDEQGEFDDDYYSDDDLDHQEVGTIDSRDGTWSNEMNGSHANGLVAKIQSAASKKKNKKKKKKGGTDGSMINNTPAPLSAPLPPSTIPPPPRSNIVPTNQAPFSNPPTNLNQQTKSTAQPPPSSRAAGKQPMNFNAAGGKAPALPRSVNGVGGQNHNHGPVSNAMGKRPASNAASSHEHGSVNGGGAAQSTTRAWSSSSAEERERIKDFWLGLNERERKNLIKIEKDGVLRKMKEQQKHGCSCAVCGRKRSSIEDELEVLYDAYYDELEQYASDQQKYVESGGQVPPPPGPGPFPGSVALDSQGAVIGGNALTKPPAKRQHQHTHPPPINRTKAALPPEDEDAYDEELEDDEYEDEYEYEDEEEEEEEMDEPEMKSGQRRRGETGPTRPNKKGANELFNFGSSLTVKGGILTVADDLLKNDGQKFLEMMEQLAERRALREEEVQAELDNASEEEDAEEEEEEEEEEEAEEDALTDEQRMEEGRRMFQIFAARMFEQRVLQAYRERVAQERQLQLLRELEEEDMAEKEREAKKAKENQKKKDKKKQAKQQKEEERMKKEEEKAAEEAAVRAKLEKQREAELKKQDEIRLKREAEKRQKDEEKAKKEEERRKRQEEDRLRELEKERKRKEKEEKIRLEREVKEGKAREAKAKEEEERQVKELREKQEQEQEQERELAKIEAERVRKEQLQQQQVAAAAAAREVTRDPSSEPLASVKGTAPKSPSSSFHAGTSSPLSRKINPHLAPSSPVQVRSTDPLAAASVNSINSVQRGAHLARPGASNQAMASPSSLPAPPQGLPARPSTVSHAPSGSLSVLAGASSLPRPPTQTSISNTGSIGSPARQGTPSNATSSSSSGTTGLGKVISTPLSSNSPSAPPPQAPAGMLFQKQNVVGSAPASHAPPMQSRYPGMTFGNNGNGSTPTRSPPSSISMTTNGYMPNSSSNSKSAFDSVLGSPSSINATTAGLSSLNIGGGMPSTGPSASSMSIGPIGVANSTVPLPPHSRTTSISNVNPLDDFGRSATGIGSSRSISRPAPGPIGPIGRRRDPSQDELTSGGMTSSIFGSNPLPERILGSSALGGDDELVEPQPRRTSHNMAPMSNSSLFGSGAFGVASPWASSFASSGTSAGGGVNGSNIVPRTPSTPNPSLLHNALGTGLTSPTSVTGTTTPGGSSAFGSIHQGNPNMQPSLNAVVDPWARAANGWDRARFAFEQPGGNQQQQQQSVPTPSFQQQPQQPPVGASPLSPFGVSSQHALRGMFGAPGQASQTSPHRSSNDRGL